MGDAHEQAGDVIGLTVDFDGFIDDRAGRAFHGDLGAVREGLAHVDGDQADLAVVADRDPMYVLLLTARVPKGGHPLRRPPCRSDFRPLYQAIICTVS